MGHEVSSILYDLEKALSLRSSTLDGLLSDAGATGLQLVDRLLDDHEAIQGPASSGGAAGGAESLGDGCSDQPTRHAPAAYST